MRIVVLLLAVAAGLSAGGCQKNPNPTETPAATNATPTAVPGTNGPAAKPGSGA